MARGKHRKPKYWQRLKSKQHTTSGASHGRVGSVKSHGFSSLLVWVAVIVGLFAIGVSVKGINVKITMEP